MSKKLNSDNLSENPVPNEDDVLSEYQNMASKEARESSNISNQSDQLGNATKAGEIDKAKNTIDQNIEGAQSAYSNLGSTSNPNVNIYPVLKSSYEDMQEDLKNYAGKVKSAKEINHKNGGVQMVSAQFEDANQKKSQFVNMIINAIKKIGELRMGIVGKMKDGGGKKTVLNILLVISIVAVLVVGGLRLLNPKADPSIPSLSGSNQPENNPLELVLVTPPTASSGGNQSDTNPLDLVLITPGSGDNPLELVLITPANPACSINFTSPKEVSELANFGPVLFQWTDVPQASTYYLKISPPADASLPWIYSINGTSRTVYMENFPMSGTFLVSINAISGDKKVLCTKMIRFNKAALISDNQNNKQRDNGNEAESSGSAMTTESAPCITTGIAYFCP